MGAGVGPPAGEVEALPGAPGCATPHHDAARGRRADAVLHAATIMMRRHHPGGSAPRRRLPQWDCR